ncbi:MAG: tetratricopeptide repeat protein [Planctomycetales bacterium]
MRSRFASLVAISFLAGMALADPPQNPDASAKAPPVAELEFESAPAVPLDEADGWRDVPSFFSGTQFYPQSLRYRAGTKQLRLRVKTGGLLVVAAAWPAPQFHGTDPLDEAVDFQERRATRQELDRLGWSAVWSVSRQEGESVEWYTCFRRIVKPGDKLEFPTDKYRLPHILTVVPEHAKEIAALKRMIFPTVDIGQATSAEAVRDGWERNDVVALGTCDPRWTPPLVEGKWQVAPGGMLQRELVRQAFLIAARDELGLSTRDRSLRETITAGEHPENVPFQIGVAASDDGLVYYVTVFRQSGIRPVVLWAGELAVDSVGALETLVTRAEALSRGAFVDVLKEAGFQPRSKPAPRPSSIVPAPLEQLMADYELLAQYEAIRRLHGEIASGGESPETLAALARSYALMGVLTGTHWSPATKVFRARGLLYAERLVVQSQASAWSLWQRAYVRTLAGLHQQALDDLAAARQWITAQGKNQAPPPSPLWLDALRACCEFDSEGQEQSESNPAVQPLVRLFRMTTLSSYSRGGRTLPGQMLEVAPDCELAYEKLAGAGPLEVSKAGLEAGCAKFRQGLYRRVGGMAGIPEGCQALCAQGTDQGAAEDSAAEDSAAEIQTRGLLMELLQQEGVSDRGEPSLEYLGVLLREESFNQTLTRIYQEVFQGLPPHATVRTWLPLVKSHPFGLYLESYGQTPRQQRESLRKLGEALAGSASVDLRLEQLGMVRSVIGESENPQLVRRMFSHIDPDFSDLRTVLTYTAGNNMYAGRDAEGRAPLERELALLRRVSPHSEIVAWGMIANIWDAAEPFAEEWERKYSRNEVVMLTLSKRYEILEQWDAAERCLRLAAQADGDYELYRRLAQFYKERGNREAWRTTLEAFLEGESFGFEHAAVQNEIAEDYFNHKEYDQALVWAERAAETDASWALMTAARSCEALGDFDRAGEFHRRNAKRYTDFNRIEYFFWCQKHNRGDRGAARRLGDAYVAANRDGATGETLLSIAMFLRMTDRPEESLTAFRTMQEQGESSFYAGLHAALLADELELVAVRDASLEQVAERAAESVDLHGIDQAYVSLAEAFRFALAKDKATPLGSKFVDELLETLSDEGEQTNLRLFAGRFLQLRGEQETALEYLRAAANSASLQKHNRTLARYLLRQQKVDFGEATSTYQTTPNPEPP